MICRGATVRIRGAKRSGKRAFEGIGGMTTTAVDGYKGKGVADALGSCDSQLGGGREATPRATDHKQRRQCAEHQRSRMTSASTRCSPISVGRRDTTRPEVGGGSVGEGEGEGGRRCEGRGGKAGGTKPKSHTYRLCHNSLMPGEVSNNRGGREGG